MIVQVKKHEFSKPKSLNKLDMQILHKLNAVKNVLKERLNLNFIPMKFKELLTEKQGLLFNKTVNIYISFS
jgi:hypothetical protein